MNIISKLAIKNKILLSRNVSNLNVRVFSSSVENDLIIEYLKQAFQPYNKPNHYEYLLTQDANIAKTKRSAVLIPISSRLEKNASRNYVPKSYFTFTKRTELMNSFKGEVCFVGGRRDNTDKDDVETALREAKEEIGIEKDQITIIGQLCPIITTNGSLITPVVAYFNNSNYVPNLNKHEVEFTFELPTERFLFKEGYRNKIIKHNKDEYIVHYFDDSIGDKQITTWGATALMSIVVSSIIHSRIPQFDVDRQYPLTNDSLNQFLDNYLLKKCKNVLAMTAKKKN